MSLSNRDYLKEALNKGSYSKPITANNQIINSIKNVLMIDTFFKKSNFSFKNKSFLVGVSILAAGASLVGLMTLVNDKPIKENYKAISTEQAMCDNLYAIKLAMYINTPSRHKDIAEYMPKNLPAELSATEYWASVNAKLAGQENYNTINFLDEAKMYKDKDMNIIGTFIGDINKMIEQGSKKVQERYSNSDPLSQIAIENGLNQLGALNSNVAKQYTAEEYAALYVDPNGTKPMSTIVDDVKQMSFKDKMNDLRTSVSSGIVSVGNKIKP